MHFSSLVAAVCILATGAVAQQTACYELQSGFGYICANDGTEVHYCRPDQTPTEVTSQFCGSGDCRANGDQGFCQNGVTQQNRARGPTDCSQVNADGGYICSADYRTLLMCHGTYSTVNQHCSSKSCFASTTGDQGYCL